MYLGVNIKDQKKTKIAILTVVCMVALAAFAFSTDMFGVRSSAYMQRFLTRNGGILKNVRFQMIYEAIMKLPSHWKGGAEMWTAGYYHVHNYWLQVANVSGIIPFALWMIVNISTVVDAVKIMRSKVLSNDMKFLLIPLWIALVCYLMMEPGGTESNRYIIFYVMLIALMKQIAQQGIEKKEV